MTPKIEKHFETNRELILVMRTIQKGHSAVEKFLILTYLPVSAY